MGVNYSARTVRVLHGCSPGRTDALETLDQQRLLVEQRHQLHGHLRSRGGASQEGHRTGCGLPSCFRLRRKKPRHPGANHQGQSDDRTSGRTVSVCGYEMMLVLLLPGPPAVTRTVSDTPFYSAHQGLRSDAWTVIFFLPRPSSLFPRNCCRSDLSCIT